jgi:hypothetical protein
MLVMRNKIKTSILLLSLIIPGFLLGQELKCNIQVVSEQIQGTNKKVFETLQGALYEFMNNRNWTNHVYTNEERIECNMLIKSPFYQPA